MAQYSDETDALLEQYKKLKARIDELTGEINRLESKAYDLEKAIESVNVPSPDSEDEASQQEYERAQQLIRQLQQQRQALLSQASRAKTERKQLNDEKMENEQKRKKLGAECKRKREGVLTIAKSMEKGAQKLEQEVKSPLDTVASRRFSGNAGIASQHAADDKQWYQDNAKEMRKAAMEFGKLADKLDDGEQRDRER